MLLLVDLEVSLTSLTCISSETHNLQRVFSRI